MEVMQLSRSRKLRVAFVKYNGLCAGGTERWLQEIAVHLPANIFTVDFFYCDATPYIGSSYAQSGINGSRLAYLRDSNVNLKEFHVRAKDVRNPLHPWVGTDFWDIFDEKMYDVIVTGKAGPPEYPFYLIKKPIVEFVSLNGGVDLTPNVVHSVHLSNWQRSEWFLKGGRPAYSSVCPLPVGLPAAKGNLREQLQIPSSAIVLGLHQRNDENIFSPWPIDAFKSLHAQNKGLHFVLLGGSRKHRLQAGSHPNIHFLDHSADQELISRFLNTLDVYTHGRRDGETFGTVLAEAMIHHLPCVSHYSHLGANAQPETMASGGFFAYTFAEYLTSIRHLIEDEEYRARLAKQAYDHARKHYTIDAIMPRVREVLESAFTGDKVPLQESYAWSPLGCLYNGYPQQENQIAHHTLAQTLPEPFNIVLVRNLLTPAHIKYMVDVGANTGLYCFIAAAQPKVTHVTAFESNVDYCDQIRKTVALNNWQNKFTIHNCAISNENKPAGIRTNYSATPINLSRRELHRKSYLTSDTMDPAVSSLDACIDRCDFIKIETKGSIHNVLLGATKVLRCHKPILFIVTKNRAPLARQKNQSDDHRRTITLLRQQGYILWRTTRFGLSRRLDASSGAPMLLCLHTLQHKYLITHLKSIKRLSRQQAMRYYFTMARKKLRRLIFSFVFRHFRFFSSILYATNRSLGK